MTTRGALRFLVVSCVAVVCGKGQNWISVGVVGGLPLTDPFATRSVQQIIGTVPRPFGQPAILSQTTVFSGGSRNFVLGPSLELRLPFGLTAEADALYRPMQVKQQETVFLPLPALRVTLPSQVNVWEFPVLAKYRFRVPVVKPYLAAGPSFRATSASLTSRMSRAGVATGGGIEANIGPLRFAPEVRYTHWGADGTYPSPYHVASYQNQVEFLMGLAPSSVGPGTAAPSAVGLLKYLAMGVKGGWPFMTPFLSDTYSRITYPPFSCGNFSVPSLPCTPVEGTLETHRASRDYLIGPSVEIHLPLHLSVEGDALYSPLSLATPPVPPSSPAIRTFNSWSFPIVGKYRFARRLAKPYLLAGPTFRTASSAIDHYLSKAGVTTGIGLEAPAWKVHISPEVRFVHWGADSRDAGLFYASRRNQAQFLLGLTY